MSRQQPPKRILFLAANVDRNSYLQLDEEVREIDQALTEGKHRDRFVFKQRGAIQQGEFQSLIQNFGPRIVHISGHGKGANRNSHAAREPYAVTVPDTKRDIVTPDLQPGYSTISHPEDEGGFYVLDENKQAVLVPVAALADCFEVVSQQVECVVLNCCHSQEMLATIGQHIRYVIGMNGAMSDDAAIDFSKGFYTALGAGKSIPEAFKSGCAEIRLGSAHHQSHLQPELKENVKISKLPPPRFPRCKPKQLWWSSASVTALVIAARFLGLLQPYESAFYDHLIHSWTGGEQDNRILIVEVTQADVRYQEKQGQNVLGSLSNESLANLLRKLDTLKPKAIGLDIYREYALNPNDRWDRELKQRFETQENLFAVCKVGTDGSEVPPPPGMPLERVGFSNFAVDSDSILRRHLLAFDADRFFVDQNNDQQSDCGAQFSFNLLLANHYLSQTNADQAIALDVLQPHEEDPSCQDLKVQDSVVFPNLHAFTGGFQGNQDTGGCQVLLNYRPSPIAETTTVEAILSGKFKPQPKHQNRIILIGIARRDGVKDYHNTPFTPESGKQMTGVEVHAQKISQILSVVAEEQPLISVLPQWGGLQYGEWILIVMGSLAGGVMIWHFRGNRESVLGVVGIGAMNYVICQVMFQKLGLWLPFVPVSLVLLLTGLLVWHFTQLCRSDVFDEGT